MKEFEIFNFDHGINKPAKIQCESFTIIVDETHCSNTKKLTRNASTTFTTNEKFQRQIVKKDFIPGGFEVTAKIQIDATSNDESILYQDMTGREFIDDIVLVLSFLTGRRVYREEDITKTSTLFYTDGPIYKNRFIYRQIKKDNISKIKELGLDAQFFNTVQSYGLNDLLSLTSYCSATLDRLSSIYAKKNGFSKYDNHTLLKKLKEKAIDTILHSIKTKIKIKIFELLNENKIEGRIIDDVVSRIYVSTSPSALYKLKAFLIHNGLYPEDDPEGSDQKLKWLNRVRNSVAHKGDLPKDKDFSWEKRSEITANITFLMFDIIQWYFAKKILELEDPLLDTTKNDIYNYFITGDFRGKNIFNETYEEYMMKLEENWVEKGLI